MSWWVWVIACGVFLIGTVCVLFVASWVNLRNAEWERLERTGEPSDTPIYDELCRERHEQG